MPSATRPTSHGIFTGAPLGPITNSTAARAGHNDWMRTQTDSNIARPIILVDPVGPCQVTQIWGRSVARGSELGRGEREPNHWIRSIMASGRGTRSVTRVTNISTDLRVIQVSVLGGIIKGGHAERRIPPRRRSWDPRRGSKGDCRGSVLARVRVPVAHHPATSSRSRVSFRESGARLRDGRLSAQLADAVRCRSAGAGQTRVTGATSYTSGNASSRRTSDDAGNRVTGYRRRFDPGSEGRCAAYRSSTTPGRVIPGGTRSNPGERARYWQ